MLLVFQIILILILSIASTISLGLIVLAFCLRHKKVPQKTGIKKMQEERRRIDITV